MKQTLDKRALAGFLAQIVSDGKLDLFRRYLEDIEIFLEDEAHRYRELLEGLKEEARSGSLTSPNEPPLEQEDIDLLLEMFDDQLAIELEMVDQFTNILRKSFFVTLYGFLESRLTTECRTRKQARDDILLSLSDINGKGIVRAKTYLVKVLKNDFSFDTSPEWQEIQEYRRLRNCIVHNEGKPDMGSGNVDKLRKYVNRKQTLYLCNDEVLLVKGFCEEALHTIIEFLVALKTSNANEEDK